MVIESQSCMIGRTKLNNSIASFLSKGFRLFQRPDVLKTSLWLKRQILLLSCKIKARPSMPLTRILSFAVSFGLFMVLNLDLLKKESISNSSCRFIFWNTPCSNQKYLRELNKDWRRDSMFGGRTLRLKDFWKNKTKSKLYWRSSKKKLKKITRRGKRVRL